MNYIITFLLIILSFYSSAEALENKECNEDNPGYIEFFLVVDAKGEVGELELVCESSKGDFKKVEASLLKMYSKLQNFKFEPNSKQKVSIYINN
ncbi:hypothetical protein [Pleionea sediminis]|uniref:hypothetical protein n=1 Tax=Pleionea sediminis TaxID=2569479 RepID=UPI0011851A7F|nr:hypothetical protein [Pleionea sediminis]